MAKNGKIGAGIFLGMLVVLWLSFSSLKKDDSEDLYTGRSSFSKSESLSDSLKELGKEDCHIKGNVSYNTREKIYHLPGDIYYDRTVINEGYGERWFCTEAEARAAGWRHSYR